MSASTTGSPGYNGQCSLCGTALRVSESEWHRELGGCPHCGLNARLRGVVIALCLLVYGEMPAPLLRMPSRGSVRILGIADHEAYASVLASRFRYINTHYHREPRLDVCDRAACKQHAGNDVVICSDVLEHTLLKPMAVIDNLLSMLAPGGSLILTAPTFDLPESIEWYGGLRDCRVEQSGGRAVLRWHNIRSQSFTDETPVFHDGSGATVELRLISHPELMSVAARLGVSAQTVEFQPAWGYSWPLVPQFPYLAAPADGRIIIFRP